MHLKITCFEPLLFHSLSSNTRATDLNNDWITLITKTQKEIWLLTFSNELLVIRLVWCRVPLLNLAFCVRIFWFSIWCLWVTFLWMEYRICTGFFLPALNFFILKRKFVKWLTLAILLEAFRNYSSLSRASVRIPGILTVPTAISLICQSGTGR